MKCIAMRKNRSGPSCQPSDWGAEATGGGEVWEKVEKPEERGTIARLSVETSVTVASLCRHSKAQSPRQERLLGLFPWPDDTELADQNESSRRRYGADRISML
ncbi:unnamed protein product [Protopolystoma xenopodis]|uniref:Uncharacterized protein n=1 Tax=Protopolystoma xenopodis TaxID=117903 RepID=A0A3S5CQC6_9PLAT|nr:unnamed protein product [Protopolystoma xenopodis]